MQKDFMDALVMQGKPGMLTLERIPVPDCGENDVLVKISKTAICGTDVHIYDWNEWAQRAIPAPMVIGHEFVGRVAVAGRNAKGFEPGMLVSGEGHVVCGKCRNCLAGRRHLCKDTQGIGVNRPGIFSQYAAIPASNIWICDESIPEDVLACFDPLGNAVHSCLQFDAVGEDVLITGAGPIGIMSAAIMRHVGARNVVVTDINPYRLKLAEQMGATRTVDVRTQTVEEIMRELNMKEGFDIGMEMSGNAKALGQMVSVMFHGGKIALLGLLERGTPLDWDKVIFSSLTLKGIYGREMYETWYKMNSMLQSGLNINPVITHRFHYKDFIKGFEAMKSARSGKVILDWEAKP
jgi:threonine 3-dehydrogenase